MQIDVVTLFPEMFQGPFAVSMLARAQREGMLTLRVIGLRPFGVGEHRLTDDYPYGGGPGMVLRPEPIVRAVEWAQAHVPAPATVLVTSAQGRPLRQRHLRRWAASPYVVVIAGHYEGIDQRVVDLLCAEEVSIGDYVLTGGELPAMVLVDGIARLLPGVLGASMGADEDSFSGPDEALEGPQYTRPLEYRGLAVPEVLRSGHHARISAWRRRQAERGAKQRLAEDS
jgi:tRNA (guanine37-N1)-methyltransferase